MKLISFRVQNFRSIEDSGDIDVTQRTALVGRNESGKSNLLLALQSLNPPKGIQALSKIKDFPRNRRITDYSEYTPVLTTLWELSTEDQEALAEVFPRASGVTTVEANRRYGTTRYIGFTDLPQLDLDLEKATSLFDKIKSSVRSGSRSVEPATLEAINSAIDTLGVAAKAKKAATDWTAGVTAAITTFRTQAQGIGLALPEESEQSLDALRDYAAELASDDKQHKDGRAWVLNKLPTFILLAEYPDLNGHQNLTEYINRKQSPSQYGLQTPADLNFEKLCKVAGFDPVELHALKGSDHEERQLIMNRAGAVVTKKIRELWSDRSLKVRFNLDGEHLDTLISDPTAAYDVEVNLDERSRGFKWFFSFYITFAADTEGGNAQDAILLLDEPGLYLHAVAQKDLLNHFREDFDNQILFTTHSPFMIPVDELDGVRTVNISQERGTRVSNDPIGDEKTLFPLQTALGYSTSQALFIGEKNLVVEGVTDFWYLSAAADYLRDIGEPSLPLDLVVTPAGGAQRVTYMVSLLTSHRLNVVVLLDQEEKARLAAEDLVKEKLIRKDNVLHVTEAFGADKPAGADVEDIIEPSVFDALVQESYAKELSGVTLSLNLKIPRIAKRYEEAFASAGIPFNKNRPAKLFLRKCAESPEKVMTETTRANFARLFAAVASRIEKVSVGNSTPFST